MLSAAFKSLFRRRLFVVAPGNQTNPDPVDRSMNAGHLYDITLDKVEMNQILYRLNLKRIIRRDAFASI
jgi:hypothetical protein